MKKGLVIEVLAVMVMGICVAFADPDPNAVAAPADPTAEQMEAVHNPTVSDEFAAKVQAAVAVAVQAAKDNPNIKVQVAPDGTVAVAANAAQVVADTQKSFASRHPWITGSTIATGVAGLGVVADRQGWFDGGSDNRSTPANVTYNVATRGDVNIGTGNTSGGSSNGDSGE